MSVIEPSVIRRKLKASPSRWPKPRRAGAGAARAAAAALRLWGGGLGSASSAAAPGPRRPGGGLSRLLGFALGRERPLPLDQAPRDIVGHRRDDLVDLLALGDEHPAVQRVLEEAVGAPVAPHLDEGDHVEKDARTLALGERQVEQVHARRRLAHDRFELAFEQRQAPDLDLAQFRDRLGAFGVLDPRAPDGAARSGFGA